ETDDTNFTAKDANGGVLDQKAEKKTKTAIFVQTILAKEKDKQASKFSNAYEKVLVKVDGKEEDVGLTGKTVIVERKNKEVTFLFADGGEVTGPALKFLQDEYRKSEEPDVQVEDAFYPKKPVKIGDSWDCDLDVLAKGLSGGDMPLSFDAKKSTGAC